MMKVKSIAWTTAVLATVVGGGLVMSAISESKQQEPRLVVRVAIGMDPTEVVRQSTYPIDFSVRGPFEDRAFKYGNPIVTANVDFEVLEPHRLLVEDVLYWGIRTEFDDIVAFSADAPRLTLAEALARAKQWIVKVEKAGWTRSPDQSKFLNARIGLAESAQFKDMESLRQAFLAPGERKAIEALVGIWNSADGKQRLSISLTHKREDGGPRHPSTPDPKDPLNDKTYLLRFSVGHSAEVDAYRESHMMELRQEALKRKGLRDPDAV